MVDCGDEIIQFILKTAWWKKNCRQKADQPLFVYLQKHPCPQKIYWSLPKLNNDYKIQYKMTISLHTGYIATFHIFLLQGTIECNNFVDQWVYNIKVMYLYLHLGLCNLLMKR